MFNGLSKKSKVCLLTGFILSLGLWGIYFAFWIKDSRNLLLLFGGGLIPTFIIIITASQLLLEPLYTKKNTTAEKKSITYILPLMYIFSLTPIFTITQYFFVNTAPKNDLFPIIMLIIALLILITSIAINLYFRAKNLKMIQKIIGE